MSTATARTLAPRMTRWATSSVESAPARSSSPTVTSFCLPKVQAEDLAEVNERQVVLGWPHCVQDVALTQVAIDRRLTLIAFEAMNHWRADGGFGLHVFHKNNELAGYCSVLHAMQLIGVTGSYGRRLRAAVIGFGATARGAVTALNAHGVDDVRVLTNRDVAAVGSPIPSTQIIQMGQHAGQARPGLGRRRRRADPGRSLPRGQRHRRQLRSAGSRRATDLRHRTRNWPSSPRAA